MDMNACAASKLAALSSESAAAIAAFNRRQDELESPQATSCSFGDTSHNGFAALSFVKVLAGELLRRDVLDPDIFLSAIAVEVEPQRKLQHRRPIDPATRLTACEI
ncbi:hypothetical protein [Bradyrhizobium sp. RDI18]|uniref:hypothetical protein n=1 Tax=Bradyrhizobium sp. RDI18 TaxID=3367400 RepID=UPI003710219C